MDCAVKFVSRNLVTQKNSLNFETVEIFYEFLGDKSPVTLGTRFLQKSRKSGNDLI